MSDYLQIALIVLLLGLLYIGMLGATARIFRPEKQEYSVPAPDAREASEVLVHKLVTDIYIKSSQDVFIYMLPRIGNKLVEYLLILLIGEDNRLVLEFQCTDAEGGYVRFPSTAQLIRTCQEQGSYRVFITHNHPNGSMLPSAEDIYYTAQLVKSLRQAGIAVQDHVIVTGGQYYSMRYNDNLGIIFN